MDIHLDQQGNVRFSGFMTSKIVEIIHFQDSWKVTHESSISLFDYFFQFTEISRCYRYLHLNLYDRDKPNYYSSDELLVKNSFFVYR